MQDTKPLKPTPFNASPANNQKHTLVAATKNHREMMILIIRTRLSSVLSPAIGLTQPALPA